MSERCVVHSATGLAKTVAVRRRQIWQVSVEYGRQLVMVQKYVCGF